MPDTENSISIVNKFNIFKSNFESKHVTESVFTTRINVNCRLCKFQCCTRDRRTAATTAG
jgi:hypothetical protein